MDYHKLTDRQRKVLELLASGKTNKEIALTLRISENTVEYHLTKRIYPLLSVRNRSAASAVYFKLATRALRKSVVDARESAATLSCRKPTMKYEIKTIQKLDELKQVYAFAAAVLGLPTAKHTIEYYTQQLAIAPMLLIYALSEGRIIGSVLGGIEDDHVLVGPVAVAESYRNRGVGSAMLRELEAQSKRLGYATLILGAAESAEDFYLKCSFDAHLFVQVPEPAFLKQLKALNTQYAITWEDQADGWTKLMLRTPRIDKVLQQRYESEFPNCSTQTVFTKNL